MAEHDNSEYRQQRLKNLAELRAMGMAPYGGAFERTGVLAEIRAGFKDGEEVRAAGRIVTWRDMGKTVFAHLQDGSGQFQVYARKDDLGESLFGALKCCDLGDLVGVAGPLFVTRTGEQTIRVRDWIMLAKSLEPLPEKWHGFRDVESRYRQRHLDLVANAGVRELFHRRFAAIREIRAYLAERGFVEVETPMMQPVPGGAAARPFVTRYDALHADMYLRIAPELYLKRLLVGGFDKVFELNRNFRNEGLSRTHNPEFTMLEIYEAYGNVNTMKALIQALILHVAEKVFGTLRAGSEAHPVDLRPPWREAPYRDLVREKMGSDWYGLTDTEARRRAVALGLAVEPHGNLLTVSHEVYEKLIEGTLQQPTFVTRLPSALVPLARACEDDPDSADVFELVICGQEVAPAYTELNDPLEQRRRLETQAGAERERIDEDFLSALEHGMPPAGGMGVGIDRLLMILAGQDAIRDVILFPQLRPRGQGTVEA